MTLRLPLLMVLGVAQLTACVSPPRVTTAGPKSDSIACKAALIDPSGFDSQARTRTAAGVAAGVLVGAFAAPVIAAGALEGRNLRLRALRYHCEGDVEVLGEDELLQALPLHIETVKRAGAAGGVSPDQQFVLWSQLMHRVTQPHAPRMTPTVWDGVELTLRDWDDVTERALSTSVVRLDTLTPDLAQLNGGQLQVQRATGQVRTGQWQGVHFSGLSGATLQVGDRRAAKLHPIGGGDLPADVTVTVLSKEYLDAGGGQLPVLGIQFKGNAVGSLLPGTSPSNRAAEISGVAHIEPQSGLLVRGFARSAHLGYVFRREVVGMKTPLGHAPRLWTRASVEKALATSAKGDELAESLRRYLDLPVSLKGAPSGALWAGGRQLTLLERKTVKGNAVGDPAPLLKLSLSSLSYDRIGFNQEALQWSTQPLRQIAGSPLPMWTLTGLSLRDLAPGATGELQISPTKTGKGPAAVRYRVLALEQLSEAGGAWAYRVKIWGKTPADYQLEATCQVPDEYLLKSRRPLLIGREVLAALVADWRDRSQTC